MRLAVTLISIICSSMFFGGVFTWRRSFSLLPRGVSRFTRLLSTESTSGPVSGLKKGQEVTATVLQFGPLGASVSVNDGAAFGILRQFRKLKLLVHS